MNHELAKTLTTALVQFLDREQPKDKMCVSSIEAEEIERCFTEEKFERIEDWCAYRMLPELTEFEKCMLDFAKARDEYEFDSTKVVELNNKVIELTKSYAKKLLKIAGKEYVSGMPMPEDTILFQKGVEEGRRLEREESHENYVRGYANGYKDAKKQYNESVAYHFPIMSTPPSGWGCDGTHCTNPQMDCINCPKKITGGNFTFNTSSGTSTLKAE